MDLGGIIFWIVIAAVIVAVVASYILDMIRWNNGINRDNGEPWELVTVDENQDRLYTTRKGGFCTISWRVEKKK